MAETEEDPLDVEAFVENITQFTLPASKERLDEYRQAQEDDPVCTQAHEYCSKQWPSLYQLRYLLTGKKKITCPFVRIYSHSRTKVAST